MTKYLMGVLLGAALLATPAQAVEWKTETTDRTDASVRMLFVKEIKMHHVEVVAAKKHRRLMREKREAAAAAEAAAATTTTPSYTGSVSGGWADELAAVGFPASVIPTMLYIIERESGGNPSFLSWVFMVYAPARVVWLPRQMRSQPCCNCIAGRQAVASCQDCRPDNSRYRATAAKTD